VSFHLFHPACRTLSFIWDSQMNDLMNTATATATFTFHLSADTRFDVRVVEREGSHWFVAADVCAAVAVGNVTDSLARVDEDDIGSIEVVDRIGRVQSVRTVNESGLYSLVLSSRKPEAKPFKKWVTSEVLPSIRKTGGYQVQAAPAELSRMQILQLAMDAEQGRMEAVAELAETTAVLSIAAPKAAAFEKLADARGSKTFREVAKFLEIKEPALRAFLSAIEMLYLLNGDWVPYAAHIDAGRLILKTGKTDSGYMFTQTRFTAKGVTWIAEQWVKARGAVAV
jgi:prophage antirepressor-like protein